MIQMFRDLIHPGYSAVYDHREVRVFLLQPIDGFIGERRNFPVFLGAKPLQPGLARMDDEYAAARCGNGFHKSAEVFP